MLLGKLGVEDGLVEAARLGISNRVLVVADAQLPLLVEIHVQDLRKGGATLAKEVRMVDNFSFPMMSSSFS